MKRREGIGANGVNSLFMLLLIQTSSPHRKKVLDPITRIATCNFYLSFDPSEEGVVVPDGAV